MKIFLTQLAALLSLPILFINSFGGIIAFVWLIFESEWTLIIQGIVAFFVSSFIIAIAFLPAFGVALIGMFFYKMKIKILAYPIFYISTLLNIAVISIWTFSIFNYALVNSSPETSLIPITLWAYGVSVGPINNVGATLLTTFSTLGSLWMVFAINFLGYNLETAMWGFLISMTIYLNIMFFDVSQHEKGKLM
jgi:hypothetical protein